MISNNYYYKNKLANGFFEDSVSLGCITCNPICENCDGST